MWYWHLILICLGFSCVFVLFLLFLHHFSHHFCCILTVFAHLLPPPTLLPPHQKGFVQRCFKRCVAVWQQISENKIPLPIWMVMKRRDLTATPFFWRCQDDNTGNKKAMPRELKNEKCNLFIKKRPVNNRFFMICWNFPCSWTSQRHVVHINSYIARRKPTALRRRRWSYMKRLVERQKAGEQS